MCLLARPFDATATRAVLASVLLYAAGMILNDHADRATDAVVRPERPIPSGSISPTTALLLGLAFLLAAPGLSPVPLWHGGMALLVLGYDYLLKRSPALGALTMGTLRGMNLLVPLMMGPVTEPGRQEAALILAAGYAVYIVCVTFLGILEDVPRPPRRAVLGLVSAAVLSTGLTLLVLPVGWPAAIGLGLAAVLLVRHRHTAWDQRTIRGVMTWLLLGTMVFTGLIALGAGRPVEAVCIAAAMILARWIARRIALT
ncbi:MAG: UbiA family prenyltransferase [Planctomycetes bacterium]|nr:UbiA family prenyltransferase [Planctomycetota bacterium]MCB9888493.1 UbiA family prenyltransferase [Planctomycetota bacterium]